MHLCVCVCVCAGLWITCQSPGATMSKMDRNFVILVFPSAAMSQRRDEAKMPVRPMWVVPIGKKGKPSLTGFYTITRDCFSSFWVLLRLPTVQRHASGGWGNLNLTVDPVVSFYLNTGSTLRLTWRVTGYFCILLKNVLINRLNHRPMNG